MNVRMLKQAQFLVVFLLMAIAVPAQKRETIILSNTTSLQRTDELIVLNRKQLSQKLGKINANKFVVVTRKNVPVVVQYDDLDADGQWDEIAFLQSFKPAEKISLVVTVSNVPAASKAVVRAHARQKRKNADDTFGNDLLKDSIPAGQIGADFAKVALPPFLTEGPAWENDKVGFRIYFDVRNGKDIWGKTTAKMMMDEVGLDTANNYHKQAAWGMDILKVGSSLGAGSLALQIPLANGKDTLVRLGGINMGKVIYEKIADGPVRAVIRLHYPEWKVLNQLPPVSVIEEISIWGGQYFYESKVTVNNAPANAKLVTGIVNLHSKQSYKIESAASKILYTFDKQSENHDELGMALLISDKSFSSYITTANQGTDITSTYAMGLKFSSGHVTSFRFYSGWSKSDTMFSTQKGFSEYLKKQAKFFSSPVLIR